MNQVKFIRNDGRNHQQTRKITITPHVSQFAEGSCMIQVGKTKLLITASLDESVPPFLKKSGRGWVTAEYGMLPRATDRRIERARNLEDGRVKEIQRLIGRSLRAAVDFQAMGERQIKIDCDVIDADGGTRTAAITGAWVALHLAFQHMVKIGLINSIPLKSHVIGISTGIYQGQVICDLCYQEDSQCQVDANIVLTEQGKIIEVAASAEGEPFEESQLRTMISLAKATIKKITKIQNQAIAKIK